MTHTSTTCGRVDVSTARPQRLNPKVGEHNNSQSYHRTEACLGTWLCEACGRTVRPSVRRQMQDPDKCGCGAAVVHVSCATTRDTFRKAGAIYFVVRLIPGHGQGRVHDHKEPPPIHGPPGEDERIMELDASLRKTGIRAGATKLAASAAAPWSPNNNRVHLGQKLNKSRAASRPTLLSSSSFIHVYERDPPYLLIISPWQLDVANGLANAGDRITVGIVDSTASVCNQDVHLTSIVVRTDHEKTGATTYVPLFYAFSTDISAAGYRKMFFSAFAVWLANDIDANDVFVGFITDFAPAIRNGLAMALDDVRRSSRGSPKRNADEVLKDAAYMAQWPSCVGHCLFHFVQAVQRALKAAGAGETWLRVRSTLDNINDAVAHRDGRAVREYVDDVIDELVKTKTTLGTWWRRANVSLTVYGVDENNKFTDRSAWDTTTNGIERHWKGLKVSGSGSHDGRGTFSRSKRSPVTVTVTVSATTRRSAGRRPEPEHCVGDSRHDGLQCCPAVQHEVRGTAGRDPGRRSENEKQAEAPATRVAEGDSERTVAGRSTPERKGHRVPGAGGEEEEAADGRCTGDGRHRPRRHGDEAGGRRR